MATRGRVEHHTSAGGVVCRIRDGVLEAVLCGRDSPRKWSLPKGTPEEGESVEETALREVCEETGLQVAIDAPVGSITYWFMLPRDGVRCRKVVHYFLMRATGGSTEEHDAEFDEVRWFPVEEALSVMQYPNEARTLEKALAALEDAHTEARRGR
ncbi:MAG: NUDIX hydrolase [Chloroflexota bacterium]|nr:NUDIX hydrolase [Chloroflexota bacterium]